MPYVTVILSDGIGNRCFQIAAMLGYAEKYGHTPTLIEKHIHTTASHKNTDQVLSLFPYMPVQSINTESWIRVQPSPDDALTYRDLPRIESDVLLHGYFQSEKYFPRLKLTVVLPSVTTLPFEESCFLHVRRGDYLSPFCKHHAVDLKQFWQKALTLFPVDAYIIVASDDIPWCQTELPRLYSDRVLPHQWIFLRNVGDLETLAIMANCKYGGICANSTFSWWGAYCNKNERRLIVMPRPWGYPPLPPARDIYPDGIVVLDA